MPLDTPYLLFAMFLPHTRIICCCKYQLSLFVVAIFPFCYYSNFVVVKNKIMRKKKHKRRTKTLLYNKYRNSDILSKLPFIISFAHILDANKHISSKYTLQT